MDRFKTFDQQFQDLVTPPRGGGQSAGGGSSGGESSPVGEGLGPTDTPTTPTTSDASGATTPPGPGLGSAPSSFHAGYGKGYEQYFDPLGYGAQQGRQELGTAAGEFSQAAGPHRSFEDIGGPQTLEAGIQGTGDLAEGTKLASAAYTGPSGLDPAALADLQGKSARLKQYAGILNGSVGTRELIKGRVHGLTPGELRFEQGVLEQDPNFLRSKEFLGQDVQRFQNQLDTATQAASQYATERTGEEAGIQKAAREYLGSKKGGIDTALGQRIAEEDAKRAAAESAMGKIEGGQGSLADLQGAPEGLLQGFTPEQFNTPTVQAAGKAQGQWDQVMQKYADIKDVPLMTLATNAHGREVYRLPEEWWAQNASKYTPEQIQSMKSRANDRQLELEAQGFTKATGRRTGHGTERSAGQLEQLMPLYFGEDIGNFMPADYRNFLDYDPGLKPSRGNVSTEQQQAQYNRIESMLGEADRLESSGEPFRAASIRARIDDYLTQEEQTLASRRETIAGGRKDWQDRVKAARAEREKQIKSMSPGAQILSAMTTANPKALLQGGKATSRVTKVINPKSINQKRNSEILKNG